MVKYKTLEELNEAAAKAFSKGEDALRAFAEENGMDGDDVEDYLDGGGGGAFAAPVMAAIGRLHVEAEELGIKGPLLDWKTIIEQECMEDDDLCRRILTKDLTGCMAAVLQYAFESKVQVPGVIVKATKVKVNGKEQALREPLYMDGLTQAKAREIIRAYYGGGGK